MAGNLETVSEHFHLCTACWQMCFQGQGELPTVHVGLGEKPRRYVVPREQIQMLESRRKEQMKRHPDLFADLPEYTERVSQLRWETAGEQRRWYSPGAERLLLEVRRQNGLQPSK